MTTPTAIVWNTAPGFEKSHAMAYFVHNQSWARSLCGIRPWGGWTDSEHGGEEPRCKTCVRLLKSINLGKEAKGENAQQNGDN